MSIEETIQRAERLFPGAKSPEGESDPRWQAIIAISQFIDSNPEEVWTFISKWGCCDDEDLRTAVATCLLEHFLEVHFDDYFPRVEDAAKSDANFADTFLRCWKFGQSELPENSKRFDRLREVCISAAG